MRVAMVVDELFAPFLAAVGPREKISTAFCARRPCSIPFLSRNSRDPLYCTKFDFAKIIDTPIFDPALNQYCLFFIDRQTFVLFDI